MLAAHLCVGTVSCSLIPAEQSNASRLMVSNRFASSSLHVSIRLCRGTRRCRGIKSILISCHSSGGKVGRGSSDADDGDRDYLEASLLLPAASAETISHYRFWRKGYQEDPKRQLSRQLHPFSNRAKGPHVDLGFLHHFQNPTIFLKITCDGDFLLPIIVGDYAIEQLIAALQGDENRDCPDPFQFVKILADEVGHEIKMVRITERVANTYFSKLCFSKPDKGGLLSVDVRPSDAISVAYRCKVPIYVNKQIVIKDAFRFGYRTERMNDTKSVYDVLLDSAADGPDTLSEELNLVKNMTLAVEQERYMDAAMLRDKLMKLRNSKT